MVKEDTWSKKFYLYILSNLENKKVKDLCLELNMSKQRINYYIKRLKENGYIEKISNGTWKVVKKEVKGHLDNPKSMSKIRSHGFGFYLKIPKITKWLQRKEYLNKENIQYKEDNLKQGQKLELKGYHIFLYNKGIRFLQKEGFEGIFTNSATLGNEIATRHVISAIKSIERLFSIDLSNKGKYQIKVTKQHHALIKNELANMYNKENRKLNIYNENGLWLIVDNSFNLDELECVHGKTANLDTDNAIKPFFNDLKEHYEKTGETILISDLITISNNITNIQKEYGENIKLHLATLQEMKDTLKEIRKELRK